VGAYSVGSISGAAFNPAVAIGVTVMGVSFVKNLWIFLISNFIGGALAAVVFNSLNPNDK
jgi:aquaporin Z